MKNLIRLTNLQASEVYEIFNIADGISAGKYHGFLNGKSAILFPSDALDKKEDIRDVCGYLNNWADLVIVRHKDISLLENIAQHSEVPVINAMTDCNHPCEILADLYSLSKIRDNFIHDKYLSTFLPWRRSFRGCNTVGIFCGL